MFGIKRVVIPMGEPVKGADGREQFSVSCPHCGSTVWVKQSKIFKRMWKTDCPNCGRTSWGRMRVINIDDEVREPVMDIDMLVAYLKEKAIDDIDPLLMEAADRLKELQEKHLSECWQIGVYSNAEEILMKCVLKEPTLEREDAFDNGRTEIRRSEWELPKTLGENVLVWKNGPYPSWVIANLTVVEGEKVWMEYRPWDDGYNPPRKIEDGPFWMPLPSDPKDSAKEVKSIYTVDDLKANDGEVRYYTGKQGGSANDA